MDEEQQNNQQQEDIFNPKKSKFGNDVGNKIKDGFEKQTKAAGKKIKRVMVEAIKKNPYLLIPIGIVLLIIFFIIALYVIDKDNFKEGSTAKKDSVVISMNGSAGVTENTTIVISKGENGSYEINDTLTDEEKDKIEKELEKSGIDTSKLTDYEKGVISGLVKNGLDVDSYTTDELKCLPKFLKAEACTSFLDLRPNSAKLDSDGNYVPQQLDDLENEKDVPGVILVQRTNTSQATPTILEYMEEADFNALLADENRKQEAINYFTINEKGNLVITKWDTVNVTVEGNFPAEVSEEEKVQNKNEYIISTTEIPYSQYVAKYTMPYDFLLQLLITTKNPKFCTEITDIVLGSKIIINIQEEETITTDVESRTYDIHSKEEKYIDYEVTPGIESKTEGHFLNLTKDDEGNDCTTYKNEKTDVKITSVYTTHTYSFEITEADTWIAHYKKTYAMQTAQTLPETTSDIDSKGEYKPAEEIEEIVVENPIQILNDNEAKTFKQEKEKLYKDNIPTPSVSVQTKTEGGKTYKKIYITPSGKFTTDLETTEYEAQEVQNEDGTVTIKYNMPSTFTVTTIKAGNVPAQIGFTYRLNSASYTYSQFSNTMGDIKCNITKLKILPNYKINLISTIKTSVKKYPSDANPVTNTHIYAKDESEKFEKFLLAFYNNKEAREYLYSIEDWLFEMMESSETTIELMDTIKYLLYVYDGTDRGVTDLNLEGFFATNMNNATSGTAMQQFLQFLHSWEGGGTIYKDENGVECYKVQADGGGGSAVGYGVDIATHGEKLRALGYDTSIGSLIPKEIVDEIERNEVATFEEKVRATTAGLDLTEYQIYALMSRCYNYGLTGGLKQATSYFKYPSNETFVSAYNKYYTEINNEEYFGDYTKTDFTNELFTQYMTWLNYAKSGTHPAGWEYRRKSEWSLFQTGYYGYDLKHGTGHGMDEYYTAVGAATDFTNNINLYNNDGSVNKDSINQLSNWITTDLLNTKIHNRTYEMQSGPFAKWWDANNNWFTSAGYRFQCTWYVYGRANQYLEMFGNKYTSWPGTKNNAVNWYYSSTNGGEKYFECGSVPRANSIAVWRDGSKAGHVAYVEAVDTVNNKVYISHAGGGRSWFGVEEKGIEQMKTLYGYQLLGYVYLDSPK